MRNRTSVKVASAVEIPEVIITSDSKRNVVEIQTTFFRWTISPESAKALAHALSRCAGRAKTEKLALEETSTAAMPGRVM
jgi:hypothetical protein